MSKIIKHSKEYHRVHYALRTKYAKANKCEFEDTCSGESNNFEWALKKGREYSDNPEDYYQLCKSCHVKYDFKGVSEKNKQRMSLLGKMRKGETPHNKGIDSRISNNCETCDKEFKSYPSKNSKYCCLSCRKNNLKNK